MVKVNQLTEEATKTANQPKLGKTFFMGSGGIISGAYIQLQNILSDLSILRREQEMTAIEAGAAAARLNADAIYAGAKENANATRAGAYGQIGAAAFGASTSIYALGKGMQADNQVGKIQTDINNTKLVQSEYNANIRGPGANGQIGSATNPAAKGYYTNRNNELLTQDLKQPGVLDGTSNLARPDGVTGNPTNKQVIGALTPAEAKVGSDTVGKQIDNLKSDQRTAQGASHSAMQSANILSGVANSGFKGAFDLVAADHTVAAGEMQKDAQLYQDVVQKLEAIRSSAGNDAATDARNAQSALEQLANINRILTNRS